MIKEIKFNYKINSKDLANVSIYVLLTNKILYYIIALVIPVVGTNIFLSIKNESFNITTIIIFTLLTSLVFVYVFFRIKSNLIKNIEKNPRIKEPIEYNITKDFIEEKGLTFEIKHFWENVKKIKETDNWFLIYITKYQALPIFKKQISISKINDIRLLMTQLITPNNFKSNI